MNNKQLSSLNELRGLAAVYIVFSHIPAASILGIELGNYGVGIFYLLSAFLTLYNAKPDAISFLKKRALRIIPLYWAVTIFTYIVCSIKPDWFNTTQATPINLIKSLFFIPYTTITPDGAIVRPILDVGWTLFLEIVFYLIFALAIKISFKYKDILTLSVMVISYLVLTLIPGDFAVKTYRDWIPYFVFGILVAMAWPTLELFFSKIKAQFPLILSTIIKLIIVVTSAKFFGHFQIPIVTLTVFLLFLILCFVSKSSKSLTFIGTVSYEIYLIHEFIVKGFSRLVYPLDEKSPLTFCFIILLLAITIAFSAVVHKLVSMVLSLFSHKSNT